MINVRLFLKENKITCINSDQPLNCITSKQNQLVIIEGHTIKNGKLLKTHLQNGKEKGESCNTNEPILDASWRL